ncbi:tetratricopeptide repeat protein, partial [bacterium]|nr:tetratricopeptide repeat protein [candidate division CSSED10-310 bacterium]
PKSQIWDILLTPYIDIEGVLEKTIHWITSGNEQVMVVYGRSGSGKSRYLSELSSRVPENIPSIFLKGGDNSDTLQLCKKLHQFLLDRLKSYDVTPPESVEFIDYYFDDSLSKEKVSPLELYRKFIRSFECYVKIFSKKGTHLIVVDDFDHIDQTFADILQVLTCDVSDLKFIVTTQQKIDVNTSTKHHELKPFTTAAVKTYLRTRFAEPDISQNAAIVFRNLTEGNIGYLSDVIEFWLRKGVLTHDGVQWMLSPPAVETSIALQDLKAELIREVPRTFIPKLPDERLDREVLRMIAVNERHCPFSVLVAGFAAREELLLEVLDRLIHERWIEEIKDGVKLLYQFKRSDFRSWIIETLSPFHRSYLHRRLAEIHVKESQGGTDDAKFLAYHYRQGDDYHQAIPLLQKAAGEAQLRYENKSALQLYKELQELCIHVESSQSTNLPIPLGMIARFDDQTHTEMESTFKINQEQHARRLDDIWLAAEREKGMIHSLVGDYGLAFESFQRMLARAQDLNAEKHKSDALRLTGQVLFYQKKYEESEKYFKKALEIREKLADDKGVSDCLNALGAMAYQLKQYDRAVNYYETGLHIVEKMGDSRGIVYFKHNLGSLYFLNDQYEKAISQFEDSCSILTDLDDKVGLAYCFYNLGEAYRGLNRYDDAVPYLQKAFQLRKEMEDLRGAALCARKLGETYFEVGKTDLGRQKLHEAAELYQELGYADESESCKKQLSEKAP